MISAKMMRTIIQAFCYYMIPAIALLIIILSLEDLGAYDTIILYGKIAVNLLVITLLIKPATIFFPKIVFFKQLLGFRREIGVLIFWFALLHSITHMYYLGLFSLQEVSTIFSLQDHIFWGLLGFIAIVLLGITSNKLATKQLGRNWKRLHYLAYLALGFVSLHQYFITQQLMPILLFVAFVIIRITAYLVQKKRLEKTKP